MKIYHMIIILIWSLLSSVNSFPRKEKCEHIQKYSRKTGEAVAIDYLIQKYELQHQKLYQEEIGEGTYLMWPDSSHKDLTDYCSNYLQHSVPGRTTVNITVSQIIRTLHYEQENTSVTNKIVIICCKFMYKSHRMVYYITRAPEPNCVYALKSTKQQSILIFNIIHKYCDFENGSSNTILKRKREKLIARIQRSTGQPIAKEEYLLKYELEHQALVEREGNNGKYLRWNNVTSNSNLNSYCSQYIKLCVPSRNHDGIRGKWKTGRLHYLKLNTKDDILVIVLHCQQDDVGKANYLLTRAFEENCVYALIRQSTRKTGPLMIIFKHCDFEDRNGQNSILQDCGTVGSNVTPKVEVKEEDFNILKTIQLFPKD